MRKLSSKELKNDMYVSLKNTDTVYKIIIEDSEMFYTVDGTNWKMPGELVKNEWWETMKTIKLNQT